MMVATAVAAPLLFSENLERIPTHIMLIPSKRRAGVKDTTLEVIQI